MGYKEWKQRRAEKKAKEEKWASFKKAFKKQTKQEVDSKDWPALVAAFSKQVRELSKWTVILTKLQPEQKPRGMTMLKYWDEKATAYQNLLTTDPKAAGTRAREQLVFLLKELETTRKLAKSKPNKQTVGETEVSVYITDIPGYDSMGTDEREAALRQAAEKTAHGLEIYEQISSGALDVDALDRDVDPKDVEALIWGLKSKAQDKLKGPYQKGAMTVPNGEALRKYLDKCPQMYSRLSSHLREQQGRGKRGGRDVDPEGQSPRGIDFYDPVSDDKPGSLPSGMNALLYQQVKLPNGETALYVKMETEGSYGHPGDNRKKDSTVPENDRARVNKDSKRARRHLMNLIPFLKDTGKEDKDLKGYREQAPKSIVTAAKAVVDAVDGKTGKRAKACLKSSFGTETKWGLNWSLAPRVSYFLKALDDCDNHAGQDGWIMGDKADRLAREFLTVLERDFPPDLLEAERRLGEEIVLTDDDMAPEPEVVEDDDLGFLDEDDEDDEPGEGFSLAQTKQLCFDLIDVVANEDLKTRLRQYCYDNVIDAEDPDPLNEFLVEVSEADPGELGDRAERLRKRLSKKLEDA